ncbi:MAG TPA: hypothetical protein VGV61_08610, partial [Thermoanaerobaculia bacterium]|nr:hypothetical protein [Thermoanaerobaculia bacterium]
MSEPTSDLAALALSEETQAFYCRMLAALDRAGAPFLVGGAYALARYTGIERYTKDFDIFVKPSDLSQVEQLLEDAGCR